jgi:hypothetical protein
VDYGVRHLRFADYRVVSLGCDGGEVREIASSAAAVGAVSEPDWRVGVVTVSGGTLVPALPRLVHTLGVVDGDGLEVTVAGRARQICVGDEPAVLAGDAPASARSLGGLVLGLSLVVDPTKMLGRMLPVGLGAHDLAGLSWFLVALVDDLWVRINDRDPVPLPRLDTAKLDLRAGPLVRLTLTLAGVEASTATSGVPVAYLLSISR